MRRTCGKNVGKQWKNAKTMRRHLCQKCGKNVKQMREKCVRNVTVPGHLLAGLQKCDKNATPDRPARAASRLARGGCWLTAGWPAGRPAGRLALLWPPLAAGPLAAALASWLARTPGAAAALAGWPGRPPAGPGAWGRGRPGGRPGDFGTGIVHWWVLCLSLCLMLCVAGVGRRRSAPQGSLVGKSIRELGVRG